jgi:uncharacterized protein YndB with AHSA1/START domain
LAHHFCRDRRALHRVTLPRRSTLGSTIQKSVLVRAAPDAVFDALVTPEKLRAWYYDDVQLEPRPGGVFEFAGIEGVVKATVRTIDRPREFSFEFATPWWGLVSFRIEGVPTGSRVVLHHEGFEGREDWLERFAWGWDAHLKNLKAFLESRPIK